MCRKAGITLTAGILCITSIVTYGTRLYAESLVPTKETVDSRSVKVISTITQDVESAKGDVSRISKEVDRISVAISKRKAAERETQKREKDTVNRLISRGGARSFKYMDMRTPSGLTARQFDIMLEGTAMEGEGYAFSEAEKEKGINGLHLYGIAGQEQQWGDAETGLKDKFNVMSINANTASPQDAYSFPNRPASVMAAADLLARAYMNPNHSYYNDGYSLYHVGGVWAHDVKWADRVSTIMQSGLNKLKKLEKSEESK